MEHLLRHGIKLSETTPEDRETIHRFLESCKVPVLITDRNKEDFKDYSFMFDMVFGHTVWTACREDDIKESLLVGGQFEVSLYNRRVKMMLHSL